MKQSLFIYPSHYNLVNNKIILCPCLHNLKNIATNSQGHLQEVRGGARGHHDHVQFLVEQMYAQRQHQQVAGGV
jgi:hypothetical protein